MDMEETLRKRLTFNISGEIYETLEDTLNRYPDTLLGDTRQRNYYFCQHTNQYFFNRNRLCFNSILFFYQSYGTLSCPPNIPVDLFLEECEFFLLPNESIKTMRSKEGLLGLTEQESTSSLHIEEPTTFRGIVWNLIENPETSMAARIYAIVSLLIISGSVVSTCLETIPTLRYNRWLTFWDNPWSIVEFSFNSWFLLELIIRFIYCPSKKSFIFSTMNWIDAIAVIPYFLIFAYDNTKVTSFAFLRILRFVRVIRLFRLSKHSKRLQVVGQIIKSSMGDLQLLLLCLAMLVIFGGSLMYFIESYAEDSQFTSIPEALWWGIVTIVTLGYGDVVPLTFFGKLLASCFMAFGALTLSLPVLSIVTKFMVLYAKNLE